MNKRDGNRPGGATGRVTERQGRKGNARPLQAKAIASVVAALFEATWATSPLANPTGAQVVTGGVTVSSPSASQMNITQSTPNAIVNWNTFSIGAGEAVNIAQPSVSAALLNRVVGNNPSDIAGRLSANGRVFLVNPAGVIFAPGSSVNVGSLVASTLNISDADFLAGRYRFIGSSLAAVRNAGTLSAQDGGTIALLGGTVSNTGIVAAKLGTVALGAGSDVTLDFAGDGLTTLKINAGTAGALIGNAGTLAADGGTVVMSAQTADALAGTVINQQGIVRAQSLAARNGHIVLDGGTSGETYVSGMLDASGGAGLAGGRIDVTGHNVGLLAGANLNASGAAGGGSVRVGGGAAGADPTIRNADAVWMDPNAQVHADAITNGNGGHIVAYGTTAARLYGTLSARGGAQGGDGGLVETSGGTLDVNSATIDASAAHGKGGQWLLDPNDVVICGECLVPGSTIVLAGTIVSQLNNGTSVTVITAGGNIDVYSFTTIAKTSGGDATFTLSAGGSITLGYSVSITSTAGRLPMVFDANVGNSASGNVISLNGMSGSPVTLNSNGGDITIGVKAGQPGSFDGASVQISNATIDTRVAQQAANPSGSITIHGQATSATAFSGRSDLSAVGIYGSTLYTSTGDIEVEGALGSGTSNSVNGVYISSMSGQTSTLATGTGTIRLYGVGTDTSGASYDVSGVAIDQGSSISTGTGGAIDIRGALVDGRPAGTTLGDQGVLLGVSTLSTSGGAISIAGSSNAASPGVVMSSVIDGTSVGTVTISGTQGTVNGVPTDSVITVRASNNGTSDSLQPDGSISISSGTSPSGTLALLPGGVDPNTFAFTQSAGTPINLGSNVSGFGISPLIMSTFGGFANVVVGSSVQTGLITVAQCSVGNCNGNAPVISTNLTLETAYSGSQGISLPYGIWLPQNTLTLVTGGPVTQSSAINADWLALAGPGTFTLTNASNVVNFLSLYGTGDVSLASTTGIVLTPIPALIYNASTGSLASLRSDFLTPAGNVSVSTTGGAINLGSPVFASGSNTTFSLQASGNINVAAEIGRTSITSTGGPFNVVFDANVGSTIAGNNVVSLNQTDVNTHGGAFTIGKNGSSKVNIQNSTIATEGGALGITGTSNFGDGVIIGYTTINSAAGNTAINGTSLYDGNGITLNQSSIGSANGSVALSGSGDASAASSAAAYSGISITGAGPGSTPAINVTGSGAVTLTGLMQNGFGTGIKLTNASIAANGGAIALTSTDSTSTATTGIQLASSIIANTGGSVTLTGDGTGNGIALGYSLISTGSGNVALAGTATGPGTGVSLTNSGVHAAGGSIAVSGASNQSAQAVNFGVQVLGDYATSSSSPTSGPAFSTTGSGAIDISGTATNPALFGYGVSINSATLAAQAGGIRISGTQTSFYGFGVNIGQSTLTAAGGPITVTGTSNVNSSGTGVALSSTLVSAGAGNVQVTGTVNDAAGQTPAQTHTEGWGITASSTSFQTTSGNVTLSGTTNGATDYARGTLLTGGYTANGATTAQPTIQTGSGAIAVNGSVPATTIGSVAVELVSTAIASTSGTITLTGLTTGTPTAGLSSTGVVLGASNSDSSSVGLVSLSTTPATTLTTGSGTLSIRGSGSGNGVQGVLVADGSQIVSNNGGAIDIRGVVTSPTTSASGNNIQHDYGTLVYNGTIAATQPNTVISIAGSTNTSDAGLAFGAVAAPAFFNYTSGPVQVNAGPNGTVALRSANDGTTTSLADSGAPITSSGGTLAILPARVDPSTFAFVASDSTPITLFGTGAAGLSIDAATYSLFTGFSALSLGSSTQTGLITVSGVCPSQGACTSLVKPTLDRSLTLMNTGSGSHGIQLLYGISLGGNTLTLASAGAVTDPGGIQAAGLLLQGPGTFTLNDPENDVGVLAMLNAGNVNFLNSKSFVIGPIVSRSFDVASNTAVTLDATNSSLTGNLLAQAATGGVGLGGGTASANGPTGGKNTNLSAGGTIDLVMENGVFTSNGTGTVSATNGWRIWASTWIGETRGNVQPNTSQPNFYGCAYGAGCSWGGVVPLTGDHFVYLARPTVIVTANGATKYVGAPNPNFGYSTNGLINGDTTATLNGTFATNATTNSPTGQYPIDPAFFSSVGYIVQNAPGTLTVTLPPAPPAPPAPAPAPSPTAPRYAQDLPLAVSAMQSFFGMSEKTFVYENNLQGTNICVGSNQPLFTTTPPGSDQDLLAVEWKRVRSQPNLNSCMLLNGQHGCGDF
ncbi:filamentous hemagglutinin N-terminal domain-containing protein [Paraburkholderia sacchari]|uniref:two-partner secretion domain-containing protein n=1 Tax=Paraburkholderia sacchari TaxID=159450 RepID=UPI001BD0AD13|nr:filamentous hemagglutinin N-terminal domain-containing protein [Paraburkholderia sacchari]